MKKYKTEEERKEALRQASKRYYQKNKEKIVPQKAKYRQSNKEKIAEYKAEYYQKNRDKIVAQKAKYRLTPYGRAYNLNNSYKRKDEKYNRGECTLTPQWIVDNIFSQPCHYCGETDWHKLGCDRIDNTKPHTPDNVVPCCFECNTKRGRNTYDEFMNIN